MQFTSPLRLEVHTHYRDEPFDLTPYVKSVSWSESTRPPWDSISAELALPLGSLITDEERHSNYTYPGEMTSSTVSQRGRTQTSGLASRGPRAPTSAAANAPPRPPAGPALASLGNRTVIREKRPPGLVIIDPGLWLKLIEVPTQRVLAFGRITDASGSHTGGGGGTVSSSTSIEAVGAMQFLRTLATEVVVTLNARVGGIMDGLTWKAYMELVDEITKRADFSKVVGKDGLISFLGPMTLPRSLFPGIETLAELFSVAHNDDTGKANAPQRIMDEVPIAGATAIASLVPNGTVADVILGIFQREPRIIELFPSLEAVTNNPLERGYADARPVLIHRIAPWRTDPISQVAVDTDYKPVGGPTQRQFERPTWRIDKALSLTRNEVYRVFHRRTEDARINAVTVNWTIAGGTPKRLLPLAGLPLFDRADVARHGAKLMELNWDMAPDQSGDLVPHAIRLRTIGLLGWHFYGLGHVFRVGTIECPYLGLRARAGEPVSADIGRKNTSGEPEPLTAYMTRVTHTVTVQGGGEVAAKTAIEFDRGLFSERLRTPKYFAPRQVSNITTTDEPEPEPEPELLASSILFGDTDLPYRSTHGCKRLLRSLPPGDATIRTDPAKIDMLVLHFTSGRDTDARKVTKLLDGAAGGAHFVLQPDGLLVQYMDLRATASHVGQDDMNRRSIGIEIMSPGASQLYANPNGMVGPWKKVTGFWYNTRDIRKKWFFGASTAQEQALRELVAFLVENFGIKARAPAYRGKHLRFPKRGHRCDEPEEKGGSGLALQPGIWHHAELFQPDGVDATGRKVTGRSDAMGIDIQDLLP